MEKSFVDIEYEGNALSVACLRREGGGSELDGEGQSSVGNLVFLHGGACSKGDFEAAFERSELDGYGILAFDFPGCGETECPEGVEYGVDDLVEITRLMIQELGLEDVHLVGHSLGGLMGVLYVEKYGGVKSLINVDGNMGGESCMFSRRVVGISFDKFVSEVWEGLKKDLRESGNVGFERYLALRIPKIFIYGEENVEGTGFVSKIEEGGGEVVSISGADHFPFYDNPEEFYTVFIDFLNRDYEK